MSLLTMIVTDAGRALLAAGPLPVVINKVWIGSGTWTPTAAATALNTPIKQISAIDGVAAASDMIHITATDESTDAYTVREIGLFVGSTLFAIYAQPTPIVAKINDAIALIATDIQFTSLTPGSVTVGAANFGYPQATETIKGVAEIATQAEANTGTDDVRMMTPLKVANLIAAAISGVRGGVSTALDTLIEIAASLGYDAHFATTMANALANKSDNGHGHSASALGFSWGEGWIKFPTGQQICAAQVLANVGEGVFTAYYPRAFAAPPIVIPVVINQAGIFSGSVEYHAQIVNTYTGYCTTFIQWGGTNNTPYAGIMFIAFGWGA